MAISDKLNYLIETKSQLRTAINSLGGSLTTEDTFRSYVNVLNNIYDYLPKVTGTGTSITLENTTNGGMRITLKASELSQDDTPTLDSPQDIHTISGDNTIVVEGKNLFPLDTSAFPLTSTVGDLTATLNSDGSIQITGTKTTSGWENIILPRINNQTMIFYEGVTYRSSFAIAMYTEANHSWVGNKSGTFTPTENWVGGNSYWTTNQQKTFNQTLYPMIIVGDGIIDGSTYELYQTPQTAPINLPVENLFDKDNYNLVNLFPNASNTFDSGWRYSTIYVACKPNTTYTISRKVLENNFVVATSPNIPVANGSTTNRIANNSSTSITITTGANDNYLSVYVKYEGDTTYTIEQILDSIMIEKGTTPQTYTPYGTTPIEYCKIGDYEDEFYLANGTNTFDSSTAEVGKALGANGLPSSNASFTLSDYIEVENGQQLIGTGSSATRLLYAYYDSSKNVIGGTRYETTLDTPFIVNATNVAYIRVSINDTTTYSNFELIDGIKNKWYIKKNIGKVVLDGSESGWTFIYSYNHNGYYLDVSNLLKITNNTQTPLLLSNYFQAYSVTSLFENNASSFGIGQRTNQTQILIRNDNVSNVEGLQTWLSTHNTIVYYILSTPTYTQITGTLETQLNNIYKNMLSYKGTTNVSQINNDLPFVLGVSTIQDLE